MAGCFLQRLFMLQVSILLDGIEAGAGLVRVQVVMADDEGTGIGLVQAFQESPQGSLLSLGARVGGLTADVEPALVADAYRVGVVVLAVRSDDELRSSRLYLSVTTDNVVVADAEVETPIAVPGVYLGGGALLVGPHRTAMNND